MRSVHPDRLQATRRDFTAEVASKGSPTSTLTASILLYELSTTTIVFFARSDRLNDVTGFNQPHRIVEHDNEHHHELYRTSNSFASMLIWHRH
jgi:hypothetical protein